jgi:hypothetical protein
LAEGVDRFRSVRGVPGVESPRLGRTARSKEVDQRRTLERQNLVKNSGSEVPVWDGQEPQGGVCLNVLLRWYKDWKQTQLTLVSKNEDLLNLLEEIPSSEAAFLPDMSQRRGVVDSP